MMLSDFAYSNVETVSVGKLRSGAELAFSKGEIDQALNLWEQVCVSDSCLNACFQLIVQLYTGYCHGTPK